MKNTCWWTRFFSCLLLLVVILACESDTLDYWPTLRGQVLDESTGNPISSAIVAVDWSGQMPAYTATRMNFRSYSTITDSRGRFEIPAWTNTSRWKVTKLQFATVRAYKSGYRISKKTYHPSTKTSYYTFNEKNIGIKSIISPKGSVPSADYTHNLIPETTNVEKKISSLLGFFELCVIDDCDDQTLAAPMQIVYDELKELVSNAEEQRLLDLFLLDLETVKYGYEEASNRDTNRHD